MASYHFSLKKFSRAKGHSVCAKAAYRSGQVIECQHYGETQDYSRRRGIEHSEIMAQDDAPEWVYDREKLWNAVEAAENAQTNRKWRTAQLAFELELALPHELDGEKRRDLTRRFIAERMVSQGMIADLNIHRPDRRGDERNHHAHVMLTMREIGEDGFGGKRSEWWGGAKGQKSDILKEYRASWADYVNREYKRLGIAERVDHRSFHDRYIDRAPQQHEGPSATSMKRKGEPTRIGQENETREQANARLASMHALALRDMRRVEQERQKFEDWAALRRGQLESAQFHSRLELTRRQDSAKDELEKRLQDFYGEHLATVEFEADHLEKRLNAKGIVPALQRMWSGHRMQDTLEAYRNTIADAHGRMDEQRGKLEAEQRKEQARLVMVQEERLQQQHEGIEAVRHRKERSLAERVAEARRQVQDADRQQAEPEQGQQEQPQQERASEPPQPDSTPERPGLTREEFMEFRTRQAEYNQSRDHGPEYER